MKSLKKRTPAKKQKSQASDMSSQDDNTIVLDLGNSYGAAQPYDNITYSSGIDTITLDPNWNTTSVTVPNGGYTISSGTSSTVNWSSTYNYDPAVNITSDGITMKEGSDIKVGGKSLTEAIEKIEERLGILHPNPKLEERWDKLKELRQQYIEMEKDLLEKEKLMKILKEK